MAAGTPTPMALGKSQHRCEAHDDFRVEKEGFDSAGGKYLTNKLVRIG